MTSPIPEYQITYIHPPGQEHDRITHYWIPALSRWIPVAEAVTMVQTNTCRFFVLSRSRNKAYAGVVQPSRGAAYLRTHADGKWDDNLRSLPGFSKAA
jgi:hypothetical protein